MQFVGTVFFNVTTFAAIDATLTTQQATPRRVGPRRARLRVLPRRERLALTEVAHGSWSWDPRSLSWWISGLNMLGSIAFGVSAVAAFYRPDHGRHAQHQRS